MAEPIDRRSFLKRGATAAAGAAVIGGGGGLLAACGSSGGGGGSKAQASSNKGISNAAPKRGGKLVIGTEAEDNGFNPTIASWDVTGLMYGAALFDTLAYTDETGMWQPYLAQSITPNSAYTTWTITLRPGIKFHDGTPCDASAVAGSLMANVKSPQNGAALLNVASITANGDSTVVVNTKEPWIAFPYYLTGSIGTVLAPAMVRASDGGNRNPVGTGPFMFKEWVPNDHFTAVRNPNYWQSGRPYLDQVTFRPIPDHQARLNAIQAGDIDIMHTDDPHQSQTLPSNSSLVVLNDVSNTATEHEVHFYMINTAKPPFDDVRVRQALAYATDVSKIHAISDPINPIINSPYVKGSPYYSSVNYPKYNPSKAKQLIQQYEAEKGPMPTFTLSTVTDAVDLARTTLVQSLWQQAGIKCNVQQVEQSQYIVQALLGNYDVREWRQFSASDPDENYVWWSTLTAAPIGSLALNFARNKDPQIQSALEKGRTSTNQADRVAAYQSISDRFAADVPYIWIDETVWTVAAKPNVQNFNNVKLPNGKNGLRMTAGFINVGFIWKS